MLLVGSLCKFICVNDALYHFIILPPAYFISIQITAQENTIHQVTTMLATSKNVLFPGHNDLLTTGTDDPSL